jgi:8-oxo-dGTP pyrophosphatase MutT (NUDIX family)
MTPHQHLTASQFLGFLAARFSEPLPGFQGQRRMAPFAKTIYEPPKDIATYKQSAVLALLVQNENASETASELELLFTVRSSELKNHSGQISFPGGRSDEGETIRETALRETCEEVGISRKQIIVLGDLTSMYVPVSKSMIYPILGYHEGQLQTRMNASEVEEIFTVPLHKLLDPANVDKKPWVVLGREVEVPFWNVHSTPLWGATAMMVAEIITLYEEFAEKAGGAELKSE